MRAIAAEQAARSRLEPGCLRFDVLESIDHPGRFVLVEEYAGDSGRTAHLESAHFRDLVLGRAAPLLARREIDTCQPVEIDEATGGDGT